MRNEAAYGGLFLLLFGNAAKVVHARQDMVLFHAQRDTLVTESCEGESVTLTLSPNEPSSSAHRIGMALVPSMWSRALGSMDVFFTILSSVSTKSMY
jgi:hypothetical protein